MMFDGDHDDHGDHDHDHDNGNGNGCPAATNSGSGLVALLDLPIHSVVGIDGKSILLQRDDFVGIQLTTTTPTTTTVTTSTSTSTPASNSSFFHFITAKAAVIEKKTSSSSTHQRPQPPASFSPGSMTVGFIMIEDLNNNSSNSNSNVLIRKYNPFTEEVDSKPVDERTSQNLLRQIFQYKQLEPHRLLKQDQILTEIHVQEWERQTSYIYPPTSSILRLRHIQSGDKIIPGTYGDSDYGDADGTDNLQQQQQQQDGTSIRYPPIPVVDLSHPKLSTHKHSGTRHYLASLTPQQRTSFFLLRPPSSISSSSSSDDQNSKVRTSVLDRLLEEYYEQSFENVLGDLQLSFVVFMNLQCLSSLEHWKDMIAMLSLSVLDFDMDFPRDSDNIEDNDHDVINRIVNHRHSQLYLGLLVVLPDQLLRMGNGDDNNNNGGDGLSYSFLEDVDDAGDNFLLPSLERIHSKVVGPILEVVLDDHDDDNNNNSTMHDSDKSPKTKERNELFQKWIDAATNFDHVVRRKFPSTFDEQFKIEEIQDGDDDVDGDGDGDINQKSNPSDDMEVDHPWMNDDDDEDDEDGPVVVPSEDIEASFARSAAVAAAAAVVANDETTTTVPNEIQTRYPILAAAIMPTEDIVMTCARALDERNDVSLVREAAAYLEEIEQFK